MSLVECGPISYDYTPHAILEARQFGDMWIVQQVRYTISVFPNKNNNNKQAHCLQDILKFQNSICGRRLKWVPGEGGRPVCGVYFRALISINLSIFSEINVIAHRVWSEIKFGVNRNMLHGCASYGKLMLAITMLPLCHQCIFRWNGLNNIVVKRNILLHWNICVCVGMPQVHVVYIQIMSTPYFRTSSEDLINYENLSPAMQFKQFDSNKTVR